MNVFIRPDNAWSTIHVGEVTCYIAGCFHQTERLVQLLLRGDNQYELTQLLKSEINFYSIIIESNNFIFAATDRVRSYPIFYTESWVSNNPQPIKSLENHTDIDEFAMLGFCMTSYTLGSKTLLKSTKQLKAGEFLLWRSNDRITHRYYRYFPNPKKNIPYTKLIEELANVIDNAVNRSIKKANGQPICVPLSGGLDSRILLAKFVEKNYPDLRAISYGLPGNFEMKKAKLVAKQLGVHWKFIPAKPKNARQLYLSQRRYDYAKFSSAFHTVPMYMEYEVLIHAREEKLIPDNSIIINGQSGDFISGGHLPRTVLCKEQPTLDDFFNDLIKKHASLWSQLLTEENIHFLKEEIKIDLPEINKKNHTKDELLSLYESWEWEERQVKAVIKGQRLYDYLGYHWDLPLWDAEIMDFWEKIPFEYKAQQKLYIDYLQSYYPKLFSTLRPAAKPWVTKYKWIPLVANVYGLLLGKKKKKDFYKKMYYYGTDHNQYALISRHYYLKHYKNTHGFGPFLVSLTLKELNLIDKSPIPNTASKKSLD